MRRTAYLYTLLAVLLSACVDEDNIMAPALPDTDAYFILNDGINNTRTVYDETDINHTTFSTGDRLGVFALDANGNAVSGQKANACYVVGTASSLSNPNGASGQVLRPETSGDRLAEGLPQYLFYYPYRNDITSLNQLKSLTHTVLTAQTSAQPFEASDLLWDVAAPANGKVAVEMDHAMCQFIITLDDSHYNIEAGVEIIQQPTTATAINLTATDINDLFQHPYTTSSSKSDIQAWDFSYDVNGSREFRAVLPACRTLAGGTPLLRATNRKGNVVELKLKNDLTLKPGRNYLFNLNRKPTPLPEIGDEDSWVLDVLDPETGEPVGLLCREYIRYQPQHTLSGNPDDNWLPNQITYPYEEAYTNPQGVTLQGITISSQCWVFYNLFSSGVPDLSHGTVMRFIYDVRSCNANGGTLAQCMGVHPKPNYRGLGGSDIPGDPNTNQEQGVYTPDHGHDWINDPVEKTGRSTRPTDVHNAAGGNQYYYEFYKDGGMHGGKLTWDGTNNRINSWTPYNHSWHPLDQANNQGRITNETAYNYGHISIPQDGSEPFVSYTPVTDIYDDETTTAGSNKAGIVVPHYLVDTRKDGDSYRINRYPLVKIGFNQFWMSKSIFTTTDREGNPLTCYQKLNENGKMDLNVNYNHYTEIIGPGYLYPYRPAADKIYDGNPANVSDNQTTDGENFEYFPYNLYGAEGCHTRGITLQYNYPAYASGMLDPISADPRFAYHAPSVDDFNEIFNYCGWMTVPLIMSRDIRTNTDDPLMPVETALVKGYYNADVTYTANISGFNLRADGETTIDPHYSAPVGLRASMMLLKPQGYTKVAPPALEFDVWSGWAATHNINDLLYMHDSDVSEATATQLFAPVRFFATCGHQRSAGAPTRAEEKKEVTRNEYVAVME